MITCPKCQSISTIPIAYGKPGPDLERAASRGLVELGGCCIDIGNPTTRCLDCGHGWNVSAYSVADTFFTDVQKLRHNFYQHILNYGSACVAYGRALQDLKNSERHRYLAMLRAFQEIDREWEILFGIARDLQHRGENSDFISDAIVRVQKLRETLAHGISDYGSSCVEYGRSLQTINDSESHWYPSLHEIDLSWERFFVEAQVFCNHYAGYDAIRLYGYFGPHY